MKAVNQTFRRIFETDRDLIEDPVPPIQHEIDAERRWREQTLHRIGDEHTERPPATEGVAPAGTLTKETAA